MVLMIMKKFIAALVLDFDIAISSAKDPPNIHTAWFVWMDYECFVRRRNRTGPVGM